MSSRSRKLGRLVLIGLIVAPVLWLLSKDAERKPDLQPAGSGRPLQRPPPIHQPRRESLDEAARAEGQNALRRIRAKWRQELDLEERAKAEGRSLGGCGFCAPGLFSRESKGERTVLRLLSLGYPEIAETWALRVAENPQTPRRERTGSVWTLGYLAEARAGSGDSALVRLCSDPDENIRWLAQYLLANADRSGSHRDLYRALARQGEEAAIEAMANWPDEETSAICKEVLAKGLNEGHAQFAAKAALARQDAFEAGAWAPLARKTILEERMLYGSCHFWWSLRLARERKAPWLEATLRQRLEKDDDQGLIRLDGEHPRMDSDVADELFLALAEMGATLTAAEEAYLRRFGYLCEPRRRLREILDERYFPR